MWDHSNDDDDPFAGIHDDADLDLLYADGFEREQAEIEPEIY